MYVMINVPSAVRAVVAQVSSCAFGLAGPCVAVDAMQLPKPDVTTVWVWSGTSSHHLRASNNVFTNAICGAPLSAASFDAQVALSIP